MGHGARLGDRAHRRPLRPDPPRDHRVPRHLPGTPGRRQRALGASAVPRRAAAHAPRGRQLRHARIRHRGAVLRVVSSDDEAVHRRPAQPEERVARLPP